ncbi:hypothetical protein [Nocardia araoensis]|uniref:hypothetical protein n=1 Tax=Nocardia araoensis TaxID=228600 RepID=UPI001FE1B60D|nr:hypothetical protein [Nocardia araoensis]
MTSECGCRQRLFLGFVARLTQNFGATIDLADQSGRQLSGHIAVHAAIVYEPGHLQNSLLGATQLRPHLFRSTNHGAEISSLDLFVKPYLGIPSTIWCCNGS